MKRLGWTLILTWMLAWGALPLWAQLSRDGEPLPQKTVYFAEVRGTINPASAEFFEKSIQKAQNAGAEAIVFELDTPGGLVSSVRQMAQAAGSSKVPVVVFVTPAGASATSAGALLMLASHYAAMSPGTNIGAAHPVGPQGKDVEGAMGEKVLNDVRAFARGLAELRRRPIDIAEKIVSKSKSLTAEEAKKAKLIDVLAQDRLELLKKMNGVEISLNGQKKILQTSNAKIERLEMSTGQKLLHLIAHPNIAAILMTFATLLIYVELNNPGVGIAGTLGAICLIVAFMAFQSLPIHTGGLMLLVLGMILMVAEAFVASGGALAAG